MYKFPKRGDTVLIKTVGEAEYVGTRISKRHRTAGQDNIFVAAFRVGYKKIVLTNIKEFCHCRMVLVEKVPQNKLPYYNEIVEY